MYNFYIEWFPMPFHDLVEVYEFLGSLSPTLLYMFQGLRIYCGRLPVEIIWIYYYDGSYYISCRRIRLDIYNC